MANNKKEFIDRLSNEVSIYARLYDKENIISKIIAYGAISSSYGTKSRAKNANNIFGVLADENDQNTFVTPGNSDDNKYKIYDSFESAVEEFVKNVSEIDIDESMEKVISTYELYTLDENDTVPFISEENKEKEEQTQVEEIEVTSQKNIIDTNNESSEIDAFHIRKGNESLGIYPNTFEEAKRICDNHPGYSVCNSKGITLYTSQIPTPSIEIKQNLLYKKGRKFSGKALALYLNPNDKKIYRTITGTFALYDGIERNGKYRVCKVSDVNNKSRNAILGWVEKSNII